MRHVELTLTREISEIFDEIDSYLTVLGIRTI